MAESKEAERAISAVEDEDLHEEDAPGDSRTAMLIATDSFEDLNIENVEKVKVKTNKHSYIHEIVRQSSETLDDDDRTSSAAGVTSISPVAEFNNRVDGSAGEDSGEQSDTSLSKDLTESLEVSSNVQKIDFTDEEYVRSPEWRQKPKHVFILSDSGKPVYSRHGSEEKIVTIFGVMQALVSFIQAGGGDSIRSIIAGDHRFVFLIREHLILVGVSRGSDSTQQILIQLSYLYNQVLSVLTLSSLRKIFKQRKNYDLRRQLSGSEKFLDSLLNMMDSEPGCLLGAVRCLPLENNIRDMVAQTLAQHAKVKDLVFALIIANSQLVTLVRMRKYFLHPMDLHLIINLINSAESFKAAESWTPLCLPKFDSSGFLQAHISYLDEDCQVCLLLLTVDRDSFFTLSECKTKIQERLKKYNGLTAVKDSLRRQSYSIQSCGITDLRHFMYKSRSTAQYTSPEIEAPYLSPDQQERLFGLYRYLHHRIHSSCRPLKILYHVGQYETLLGWVTQGFELYAVFGPLVTKSIAINAINKLLTWIKKEENRLFILNSVTF